MYHMHSPLLYTENVCILAGNGEEVLQSRYNCIFACNRHWKSDNMHTCHSVSDESLRERLLVYNVPHLRSLPVYKWRFSGDRKWLRTAAQLLGCRIWQHSSEMWITCTVAIRLVRQLDLICLFVCNVPHAHFNVVYRKRVHIGNKWWENAAESLHLHICM